MYGFYMKELFRRLLFNPRLAAELVAATFFINLLSLASPIYVIQILNRYVGYGFDGTLVTLTTGMLAAIALSYGFTVVRTKMASAISLNPDRALSQKVLSALTRARMSGLNRFPHAKMQETLSGLQVVEAAYDPTRIASVLDMPFFLLFIGAVLFLSPLLALVTLLAVGVTMLAGWMSISSGQKTSNNLRDENMAHRALVTSAINGAETVRAFNGSGFLGRIWDKRLDRIRECAVLISGNRSRSQAVVQTLGKLLRVMVYALGAMQAVEGVLTVGALIGVSILSSKALQISTTFMSTRALLQKADESMALIDEFLFLPLEPQAGSALKVYSGRLELKDLGFGYPGSAGPLFESISMEMGPGSMLAVAGPNGSGKTTFAKLLVGLLEPGRGQILADGVELRQLSAVWWRRQVIYLPQEPSFLNVSIRENIVLGNPEIDNESFNEVIRKSDLRGFLDTSRNGVETMVMDSGRNLPLGIRKRLALARALAVPGSLAVLDEPTEGLDSDGRTAVYAALNELLKRKVSIVVISSEPNILNGAAAVLDFGSKPVPLVRANNSKSANANTLGGENG